MVVMLKWCLILLLRYHLNLVPVLFRFWYPFILFHLKKKSFWFSFIIMSKSLHPLRLIWNRQHIIFSYWIVESSRLQSLSNILLVNRACFYFVATHCQLTTFNIHWVSTCLFNMQTQIILFQAITDKVLPGIIVACTRVANNGAQVRHNCRDAHYKKWK